MGSPDQNMADSAASTVVAAVEATSVGAAVEVCNIPCLTCTLFAAVYQDMHVKSASQEMKEWAEQVDCKNVEMMWGLLDAHEKGPWFYRRPRPSGQQL